MPELSTIEQSLDNQQAAFKAAASERIYSEKVSGMVSDRKTLGRAIAAPQAGDVFLVTRLDRLAGSTLDLLDVLATLGDRGTRFSRLPAGGRRGGSIPLRADRAAALSVRIAGGASARWGRSWVSGGLLG